MQPNLIRSVGVFLVIGGLLFTTGCDRADETSSREASPPAVRVEVLHPMLFKKTLVLTGTVEAATLAVLSSPAEGPVQNLRVREGDRVTGGEVVLTIGRSTSADAALKAAREEATRQSHDLERVRALVEQGALPGDHLDTVRAAYEHARASLALAEQAAGDFTVAAPWEGLVSRVHVADGRYVGPRAPLVDLFDPTSLVLRFHVPEQHAFAFVPGDRVEARFDSFPGDVELLRISRAWPELDRQLRTRTFEAILPEENARPFAPGQFARLRLVLERIPDALTVPVEAVVAEPDGSDPRVYRVNSEGLVHAVTVAMKPEEAGRVTVQGDLRAGDRIIVAGLGRLADGVKVRIAGEPPVGGNRPKTENR